VHFDDDEYVALQFRLLFTFFCSADATTASCVTEIRNRTGNVIDLTIIIIIIIIYLLSQLVA